MLTSTPPMLLLERHSNREEALLLASELATPPALPLSPSGRIPRAPAESPSAAPATGLFEILGGAIRPPDRLSHSRRGLPRRHPPRGHRLRRFVENVLGTPERRAAIWRDVPAGGEPDPEERIVPPLVLWKEHSYKEIDSELAEPVFTEPRLGRGPAAPADRRSVRRSGRASDLPLPLPGAASTYGPTPCSSVSPRRSCRPSGPGATRAASRSASRTGSSSRSPTRRPISSAARSASFPIATRRTSTLGCGSTRS